ncbi:MAG: HEAT repeat domain-containing protein [bacterium]|nr:HEAT repeat domain-containing protein [bacterium]
MSKAEKSKNNPKKLLKLLKEGGYEERSQAAFYLGEFGDKQYFNDLKQQLFDPVPGVVHEVMTALTKLGMDSETENQIKEVLQGFKDREEKLNAKVADAWKEKTEEEKQEELRRYASESHLREAERQLISQDQEFNKNWLYAAIVIGIITLLFYLFQL